MGNKAGIVVCTRMQSSRVPNKCALDINGKSILEHLHNRLLKTKTPITYAYPLSDYSDYLDLFSSFENTGFHHLTGHDEDPLQRMYQTAKAQNLDIIIRVVHDKIFIDDVQMRYALSVFKDRKLDYLYSSTFTDGTAFEIISFDALEKAAKKYENVEHITYAIKAVTDNSLDLDWKAMYFDDIRLLIDFPEDVDLMRTIFACLGNDCSTVEVMEFMSANEWAKKINKLPKVTVYTCAYNSEEWLTLAMNSVIEQRNFNDDYEYLLIDDCSSDKTSLFMSKYSSFLPNIKYIRNTKNIGLASSSNIALSKARGKYIIRLDADDYFIGENCVEDMLCEIKKQNIDALYPNYYKGDYNTIGLGNTDHHPAGTLFKTLSLNHLKFKEGLRHFDGFDLYKRALEFLKIGYMKRPIFFYRQHENSLSKNNLKEREEIKKDMDATL